MISINDLLWFAGLMEGEGWFGLRRGGADLTLSVSSVDEDVIERVRAIFGFGQYRRLPLPSGKTEFRWTVLDQAHAAGLMMTLLPLMGKRRALRIQECLAAWQAKPLRKSMWTHCKSGHELSGDNLRIRHEGKYTKRRCRECEKLRTQKYRASA